MFLVEETYNTTYSGSKLDLKWIINIKDKSWHVLRRNYRHMILCRCFSKHSWIDKNWRKLLKKLFSWKVRASFLTPLLHQGFNDTYVSKNRAEYGTITDLGLIFFRTKNKNLKDNINTKFQNENITRRSYGHSILYSYSITFFWTLWKIKKKLLILLSLILGKPIFFARFL